MTRSKREYREHFGSMKPGDLVIHPAPANLSPDERQKLAEDDYAASRERGKARRAALDAGLIGNDPPPTDGT